MNEAKSLDVLSANAKARTAAVVAKLKEAISAAEIDIERNDGIYPYNGGRLNRAELCRRAGVRTTVLGGPSHRMTTLVMVRKRLAEIRQKMVAGSKAVRQSVTARSNLWRDRALASERHSNLYHLKMVTLENELQAALARVSELEGEIARLQEMASQGRIVRLPRSDGRGKHIPRSSKKPKP